MTEPYRIAIGHEVWSHSRSETAQTKARSVQDRPRGPLVYPLAIALTSVNLNGHSVGDETEVSNGGGGSGRRPTSEVAVARLLECPELSVVGLRNDKPELWPTPEYLLVGQGASVLLSDAGETAVPPPAAHVLVAGVNEPVAAVIAVSHVIIHPDMNRTDSERPRMTNHATVRTQGSSIT